VIKEEFNESSSGSDSGQSEDNLDAEELIKIMPKRMAKKKMGQMRKKRTQIINQITQAVRKTSTKEDE
jgi:hypothetical protein